ALNLGWRHRASAVASLFAAFSLLRGRWSRAVLALGTLVALNRSFYALLLRKRGRFGAMTGVGLHVVHHVLGALSVPIALLERLRRGAERRSTGSRPAASVPSATPAACAATSAVAGATRR